MLLSTKSWELQSGSRWLTSENRARSVWAKRVVTRRRTGQEKAGSDMLAESLDYERSLRSGAREAGNNECRKCLKTNVMSVPA